MTSSWPNVLRTVHLIGGLRALNATSEVVEIMPTPKEVSSILHLSKYGALYQHIQGAGGKVIGVDFITDQAQIEGLEPVDWQPFDLIEGFLIKEVRHFWAGLATAAHFREDFTLVDICRRIVFQLEAISWRLRCLSDAYYRELRGCIASGNFDNGQKIVTGNSFHIFLETHTFLSECSTLRDYLAEFIWKYICSHNTPSKHIRLMSALVKELKKSTISSDLENYLLVITSDGGWLKRMSAYRDLAVHYTPLATAEKYGLVTLQSLEFANDQTLPVIQWNLPRDPEAIKIERSGVQISRSLDEWIQDSVIAKPLDELGPDALAYSHQILQKLAGLAGKVGALAPVRPQTMHFKG